MYVRLVEVEKSERVHGIGVFLFDCWNARVRSDVSDSDAVATHGSQC